MVTVGAAVDLRWQL